MVRASNSCFHDPSNNYFCRMFLVDSHTHLYLEQFDNDRSDIVKKAIDEGVKYMLLPNIDKGSHKAMMDLNDEFPKNCLPMIGLHPTSVNADFEIELKFVEEELKTNKYCAVGEIGMDLYWDKSFREQQEEALRRQLRLASQFRLPVSIHTRDAFDEIYHIVKDELNEYLTGIFHCFTGSLKEAAMITDMGFKLGIGGIVTFKNSGLGEVLKNIPLESLVLETDAPFLTPVPFRGKRNESAYTTFVAKKLAEIKVVSLEEVAKITSANAVEIFNLKDK